MEDAESGEFAVVTPSFVGNHNGVLLVLILNNRNGRLGNTSMMSAAFFRECMKSYSGDVSTRTSTFASVVTITAPSGIGLFFVCFVTRTNRRTSYLSCTIVTSSTLSLSCAYSVLPSVSIISTGGVLEQTFVFLLKICFRNWSMTMSAVIGVLPRLLRLWRPSAHQHLLFESRARRLRL